MTRKKKSATQLIIMALLGMLIGSLFWETVERIIQATGQIFSLTIENPLTIDLHVLIVSVRPNIGTVIGFLGGIAFYLIM